MNDTPPLILHVEDDDDDVFAISDAFARSAVRATLHRAANGQLAIDYLQNASAHGAKSLPRLILLDLNMPVMTGHQFLQWRASQPFKRIPVVVLSSSTSTTDITLAMQT